MRVEYLIFVDFISIFQAHTQEKRMYLVAPKNYLGSAHYARGLEKPTQENKCFNFTKLIYDKKGRDYECMQRFLSLLMIFEKDLSTSPICKGYQQFTFLLHISIFV